MERRRRSRNSYRTARSPCDGCQRRPEDQSEALGLVLDTDLLTADLADLNTAHTGFPSEIGPGSTPLNLELLNALEVDLGDGIMLPLIKAGPDAAGLLELGELGALNS
ncbi:hypothetical protein [Brevibacterium jeotgali]|uniref:Uncharacterized protein n=1 Tax=Brevibacterium jeotgali TaxID=1262550 RepID=A0A2H1L7V3_9MICO|nr:hypothetical protein [Brevibacterium jeotgali]TWC03426.1 hypothetical protein FB108_2154 [Brevibacterium jeotgali]SMY12855.1 hypothetical protein BJEO58_02463 [Brevibacterium jeotgali]